jgi:hypothetical protein
LLATFAGRTLLKGAAEERDRYADACSVYLCEVRMGKSIGFSVAALLVALLPARAQELRPISLGQPTASFREPFSRVAGVRELSDGRVVVLDNAEGRIILVNFRAGVTTSIGRPGPGPAEYTLPIALVALNADTTLAVDMSGGGRALVIAGGGASKAALAAARVPAGQPLFSRPDIQADADGRIYELVPRFRVEAGRRLVAEYSGVRRLDRRTGQQDTIGQLSALVRSPLLRIKSTSSTAGEASPAIRGSAPPPFASVDQWAVAADGRIAFVTVDPYRVSFVAATGQRIEGPAMRVASVVVDRPLKDQWRQLRQQPVATLRYGPSGVSAGWTRPTFVEPAAWPATLPPFLPNALRFAPDGTLWIERAVAADLPQSFDLIDRNGSLARRVVMPPRTRLVGFGVGTVYTVRIDEDQLEYLQRYRLPL